MVLWLKIFPNSMKYFVFYSCLDGDSLSFLFKLDLRYLAYLFHLQLSCQRQVDPESRVMSSSTNLCGKLLP